MYVEVQLNMQATCTTSTCNALEIIQRPIAKVRNFSNVLAKKEPVAIGSAT